MTTGGLSTILLIKIYQITSGVQFGLRRKTKMKRMNGEIIAEQGWKRETGRFART